MGWRLVTVAIAVISSGCLAPAPPEPVRPNATATAAATADSSPIADGPTPATPTPPPEDSIEPSVALTFSALAFFDRDHGLLAGAETFDAEAGNSPTKGLLWRTSDGGATWDPIAFDGAPILTFATADARHVWAATGCLDATCPAAILASDDAGETGSAASDVLVESLSFVGAEQGWAVTESAPPDGGDLLETHDGGRTWTTLRRACPIGLGVAASFVSDTKGWLGCASEGGAGQELKAVLETTNGGRTWAVRSEAGIDISVGSISSSDYLAGIAMRPSGVGLIWMARGTTTRTTDAGRTWRVIPPGEFDVTIPASAAVLDDRTWILLLWDGNLGRQTVVITRDGGSTWKELGPLPG